MTISVFLSSFLVITIEKDWWGGYLSGRESDEEKSKNWNSILKDGRHLYKANPTYVFENTIRLIMIGVSISFFQQIAFTEVIQLIYSLFCILYNYMGIFAQQAYSMIGSSSYRRTKKQLSNKEVCRQSTILISNI